MAWFSHFNGLLSSYKAIITVHLRSPILLEFFFLLHSFNHMLREHCDSHAAAGNGLSSHDVCGLVKDHFAFLYTKARYFMCIIFLRNYFASRVFAVRVPRNCPPTTTAKSA